MNTITSLFEQAQLAEAAYAKFINSVGGLITTGDELKAALIASGFSQSPNDPTQSAQATEFVKQWRVVDHIPDTASGFSATLFERLDASGNRTGEFNLAIRGSTFDSLLLDFRADAGDIFLDGLALDQFVDLYNYWQRLSTPAQSTYTAAKLVTLQAETVALRAAYLLSPAAGLALETALRARADVIIDNPTHTVETVQFVDSSALSDINLRQGVGAFPVSLSALNVSGHSLGGHLVMAFTRLFPGINTSALAINGLGFLPTNSNVDHLFAMLGGAPGFDAARILNVFGIAGPEFAADRRIGVRS